MFDELRDLRHAHRSLVASLRRIGMCQPCDQVRAVERSMPWPSATTAELSILRHVQRINVTEIVQRPGASGIDVGFGSSTLSPKPPFERNPKPYTLNPKPRNPGPMSPRSPEPQSHETPSPRRNSETKARQTQRPNTFGEGGTMQGHRP